MIRDAYLGPHRQSVWRVAAALCALLGACSTPPQQQQPIDALPVEEVQRIADERVAKALGEFRLEMKSEYQSVKKGQFDSDRIDLLIQNGAEMDKTLKELRGRVDAFSNGEKLRNEKVAEALGAVDRLLSEVDTRLEKVTQRMAAVSARQDLSETDLKRANQEIKSLNQEMAGAVGYLERVRQGFVRLLALQSASAQEQRDSAEHQRKILEDLLKDDG